jgi:hypothetical protein
MAVDGRGRLGVVAYAFEPRRRPALRRALRSLAAVAPWPAGTRLAVVRRAGQPPFGDPGIGLPVLELEDDGRRWEFGAWQAGVEQLGADAAAWLLLNDTAGVNDPWPQAERARLRRQADGLADDLAYCAEPRTPLLAGALKPAPAGCALEGQALPAWVQTQAFVLSADALRALDGRLFDRALFEAPQVEGGRIRWPDTVSPALAAHIGGWLTRPGKDGWRHHSGRAEVPEVLLRDKAGAILLEKRLAARVLAAGGQLVDCSRAPTGPWQRLQRRVFYWQRRLGLALPPRRAA